jgi:cytochrome b561
MTPIYPIKPQVVMRYSSVAIVLHWAIALFILFNLGLGYFMEGVAPAWRAIVVPLHISAGISVLTLTILRVLWRVVHAPPPHAPELTLIERSAAHGVHLLLYAGMLLMPLSGWAILSAHPAPGTAGAKAAEATRPSLKPPSANSGPAPRPGEPMIWGLVPLPTIAPIQAVGATPGGVTPQKQLHDAFAAWHGIGGWVMIVLLVAHVLGALKHQYIDRQPELERMGVDFIRRSTRHG